MVKYWLIFLCFLCIISNNMLFAQTDYKKWLKKENEKLNKYIAEEDQKFANFLKKEWKKFNIEQGLIKDEKPKPVEAPKIKNKPMEINIPKEEPKNEPSLPIKTRAEKEPEEKETLKKVEDKEGSEEGLTNIFEFSNNAPVSALPENPVVNKKFQKKLKRKNLSQLY